MKTVHYIYLKHFSKEYSKLLNSFELPEEQAKFTALPSEILEVEEGRHQIVILSKDEPVGFFCCIRKIGPIGEQFILSLSL